MTEAYKILFVCLGNICRSPAAEGIFRVKAAVHGLSVDLDSAGTGAWHVGHPPDERMIEVAQARGYDLSALRARQVDIGDFYIYDHILAMDQSNFRDLKDLQPADGKATLSKMLDFGVGDDVPDPYYGAVDGFNHVIDLLEEASDGLLHHLRAPNA